MTKLSDECTMWLSTNKDTYEFYILHAICHDPQLRADLLGKPLLSSADFTKNEHALVVEGLIQAMKIMPELDHKIAYPPTPEFMKTYIELAANILEMNPQDIKTATKLMQSLQDPVAEEHHDVVRHYFEAWFTTVRAKKHARRLQMNPISDVTAFMENLDEVVAAANEITDTVETREFDFDKPPEPPKPILKLGEHTICTPGNISNIQGPPKAAKSAVVGAILASTLQESKLDADTLGFVAENSENWAVIHIDTEQSAHDHDSLVRRAYKRAKRASKVDWLHSYCLTGMEPAMCWDFLQRKVGKVTAIHSGIKMVIIDGIADFCSDPNDAKECFNLVRKLHKLALDHQCVIITVLHENPGSASGKTRGHLGSQLDRKAETSLRLVKDEKSGSITMWADRARHCFMPKKSGWQFHWCDEAKMHVVITEDNEAYVHATPDKSVKFASEVAKAFGQAKVLSYTDLVKQIVSAVKIAESTAKSRIPHYERLNLVGKTDDGKYQILRDTSPAAPYALIIATELPDSAQRSMPIDQKIRFNSNGNASLSRV